MPTLGPNHPIFSWYRGLPFREVKLTIHLCVVLRLKMGEAAASVPCITSCHTQFYLDLYLYSLSLTPELIS